MAGVANGGVSSESSGRRRAVAKAPTLPPVAQLLLAASNGATERLRLARGETLVEQGSTDADLFVLVSGRLEVVLEHDGERQLVSTLEPGAVLGEIALLTGGARTATVRAASACVVVRIPSPALRELVETQPALVEQLAGEATRRLRRAQLLAHLNRLFAAIPADAVAAVEQLAEWVSLQGGEQLFAEGDPGDATYLVVSGRLRAVQRGPAGAAELGEIARGELVGEMALLDHAPRSASVFAVRDTNLVRFSRAAYAELFARYPQAGMVMAQTMLRRVRTSSGATPARVSVVVVPASPGVDVESFVQRLTASGGATTRTLSSGEVDRALGLPGIAQVGDDDVAAMRLNAWLEEVEEATELLVLEVDQGWTPWSRRALRWADTVLLVADARDDPTPAAMELGLWSEIADHQHPTVRLALVHPAGTTLPSGTVRWLEPRPVAAHHHVRDGDQRSFDRLARLLAGRGTSLVLGGGGARGFAHLGVLQVLEELGQEVDMVAGSSIGAIMAVGPAMGWPAAESRRVSVEYFRNLFDYTLPMVSLLQGRRITAKLQQALGDVDIADLWLPYFCVSTNLTSAGTVFHDRGPLVQAIRASIAIPGVLPPVPVDGALLVDGGVLDNVPVAEMRRRNPHGSLVAVDVAPVEGPAALHDYGLSLSGRRAWLDRRRGAAPPSLLATLVRSSLVGAVRDRNRVVGEHLADLYLDLDVEGGALLDFSAAGRLADAGATATRPVLDQWARSENRARYIRVEARPAREHGGSRQRRSARAAGVLLLTLRDVQFRAARFGAVVVGTAVVLALLFLMTGLVEQFHREPRDTVRALGADHWVLREGASGAFTSAATVDASVAAALGPDAAPAVVARHSLRGADAPTDIVVFGFRPGGLGAPPIVAGRAPAAAGEVALDETAGLSIGDRATIGATTYSVVGHTRRTTMFAGMPVAFLELRAAQTLVYRGADLATAVLVDGLPATLPPGTTVLPARAVADDALRPLERSISSVNLIRLLLWFVAAMIVGTMVYLSAVERTRDVAVLKAVGTSTGQLVASIALQGAVVAGVAGLLAIVLQEVLVPVFPLEVTVPGRALVQIPVLAVLVSLAAGAVGIRKAIGTDPALAFGGRAS